MLKKSIDTIANAIAERKKTGQRFIVGIAGAPGAGKSTVAGAFAKLGIRNSLPADIKLKETGKSTASDKETHSC